jgi:DUF4097 and DUF4098 domain-containing protein YvlB
MRFDFVGRLFVALACASLLGSVVAAFAAGEVIDTTERSFAVAGRPTIFLRNTDGRTRISAGSEPQVRVKAVKEVRRAADHEEALRLAGRVQIRIEQSGNRIEVEARYPRRVGNFFGSEPEVLVHFEISAPKSSDVDARSSDGPLDVYGFDGQIDVTTGDGELTADNCSGRINAKTGEGSLRIESARGEISAHSGNGRITLDGVFQVLEAKSGDGRIDIIARAGSKMERDWSIRSSDGDVRLRLPEGFAATLEASSSDGQIDSEQQITMEGSSAKNRLTGKLNSGGYRLRIQTGDGNISIRKS